MRLDIENKILIPFMALLILSIATLGFVSYWNGYQLLLNNEIQNISKHLKEMALHIDDIQAQADLNEMELQAAQLSLIQYYDEVGRDGVFIKNEDGLLVNHFKDEAEWLDSFYPIARENKKGTFQLEKDVFVYQSYEPWGWVLGYGLSKRMFSQEVLEAQKYVILLAIVSLIFSMQASIFIAYNISKPIKLLAELCDKIGQGNLKEKINIRRKDEIGMLATAFNDMVVKLQINKTKLLEMTRLNEDILRNISTGIMTTDQKGHMVSMNTAATELLNLSDHEILEQKKLKEVLHQQILATLDAGKSINEIQVFHKETGEAKLYIDVITSLLRSETGEISGAICSFRDITERKLVENSMETLDRLTSMGQLAAGMAHEIRNPLAGMKTSIQVLKKRLSPEDDSSNHKLFNGVLYEIDRINQLITDLLNFARPKTPRYEIISIMGVLQRALDLTSKGKTEVTVEINFLKHNENLLIFADKDQIEQIFINIIKNALKAMRNQGALKINLSTQWDYGKEFSIIEFQDDGCGIAAQNIEKIFDPFFTTDSQGTGLGLSVVYELVKENRGSIEVSSRVDLGTKFKLTFPLHLQEVYFSEK
ncbi:multi-sensor signal transduction histidine kinase [Alkaliphilus metalliredigens QYMF]|uniref:histidine kinase n=1 Tax=Alkaliphilus metalliredigens (strain QYMF) TaxID=293826 RepID=A6TSG0_ALKMQ|nr:ATP-binding protein [Alkaliphilus metalliredigens]ABR49128.1 multi-sensor signal transduction histidine kinase [Alkaliphilus metalliredigens QYMF]